MPKDISLKAAAVATAKGQSKNVGTIAGRAAFARKLSQAMRDKDFTASRLAGEIWGYQDSMISGKSYRVSRNRDRMSAYLAGRGYPRIEVLKKMAEALGVDPEALAPEVLRDKGPPQEVTISAQPGDKARLSINSVVPAELAIKISGALVQAGGTAAGTASPVQMQILSDGTAGILADVIVPHAVALSVGKMIQAAARKIRELA